MNKSSEQNTGPSSGSTTVRKPTPGADNTEPQSKIAEPLPGIKPETQDTLHLATNTAEPVGPANQVAANRAANSAPAAARGDDDLMSQPPRKLS